MNAKPSAILAAINALDNPQVRSASIYLAPRLVITATRRLKPDKRNSRVEVVLTIGKPNYAGRQFTQDCLKAGVPFPVKKPQLKFYPQKRRAGRGRGAK